MVDEEPLMKLVGITKRFGHVIALKDVDFEVRAGECVGLVGDNGAGKSTLAKIMIGFYRPDSGEIYFEGKKSCPQFAERCAEAGHRNGLPRSSSLGCDEHLAKLLLGKGVDEDHWPDQDLR